MRKVNIMRTFNYSKYKEYKWDAEILRKVSSIYKNKGKLEVLEPRNPELFEKLIENAQFESVVASNAIEGIKTTNHRFKQLFKQKITPKNRSEEEIAGYKDTINVINESYEHISITPNYILQLHNIMYEKVSNNSIGGRFKNVQNYISATSETGEEFTIFTPLSPVETPQAITDICNEYNKMIKEGVVNPLILTFIFLLDFLAIHPFNDGNGRMSRLLTNLLLYRLSYYVGKYVSLENKIAETKDSYYDALLDAQKGWEDDNNDPTPFISYMLGIVERAYNDLETKINLLNQNLSAYDIVKQSLTSKIGKITKAEVLTLCPTLSSSSVEKSLAQLVNEGKLEKKGAGKNTFYVIKM